MGEAMRKLLLCAVLVGASLGATSANAACVCRCVNGIMQPLYSSSIDLRPICPPRVCPITPPRITPIQPPTIPPLGTSSCRQAQVLNPATGWYEWRTVCR